jgi:hypothetical protein
MPQVYPEFKKWVMEAGINWTGVNVVKGLLLKGGGFYSPSHKFIADVIAGGVEMSGGSYARYVIPSRTLTIVGGAVIADGDPAVFTALPAGNTIVALVLQGGNTGGDSTDRAAGYYDGGTAPNELPKATTGGDLTCNPHPTDGWMKL